MTTAMTDLMAHVADPERTERIEAVRRKIDALKIDYVYVQFVSVTGRVLGKGIPSDHWESVAKRGVQTVYSAMANVAADRRGDFIGYGSQDSELVALPDPETFCQLPWNKRAARVFCTLFRNREEAHAPGSYLTSDSRGNLKRIYQAFQDRHDGLQMRVGCEPEMLWLKKGSDGKPDGGMTSPYAYHVEQFEVLSEVIMRVNDYARAMGLDMIQADHEDAPGQVEQNFQFDDCLRTADRLTTYRQICAQVGREFGLIPCFMSKPYMGVSANGCHHNISFWRGGEDVVNRLGMDELPGMEELFAYRRGGDNAFRGDGESWRPSALGEHCIAGIVSHMPALTAIGCSSVNSYRRMLDLGLWAPVFADWGLQNRTCALRVSSPDRMEYRSVDSMVNPYLMMSALLQAVDHGIGDQLDAGDPQQGNVYDLPEEEQAGKRLPTNLGEALAALAQDDVVRSALPGDMYRVFEHHKRDEWERFNATVTQWDVDTYIDCLP